MSEDDTTPSAASAGEQALAGTGQDAATSGPSGDAGREAPEPKDAAEAVYDEAFEKFLGPDSKEPAEGEGSSAKTPADAEPEKGQDDPAGDTARPPDLTEQQKQLLGRLHMKPEMMAGWSDQQRQEFLENAAKREADQTTSYKKLQEQVSDLAKRVDGKGQEEGGQGKEADDAGKPPAGFAQDAQKVADRLVDDYGDEIGEAGKLLVSLAKRLDAMSESSQKYEDQLETANQAAGLRNQLIVEMTIESGIRDLVGEYPSLAKPQVREKVENRFMREWKSEDSPHRKGKGTLLQRVRDAIRDAAKVELGNNTETAAQVALVNKNKQQLRSQPPTGAGKSRPTPQSEDDIYNQAFEDTLGKELRRR